MLGVVHAVLVNAEAGCPYDKEDGDELAADRKGTRPSIDKFNISLTELSGDNDRVWQSANQMTERDTCTARPNRRTLNAEDTEKF